MHMASITILVLIYIRMYQQANRDASIFYVLSLSTVVLNSRDWSEIIWLPRNSHFKINLPIGLYPKKPAGMHWLGRNDAVS